MEFDIKDLINKLKVLETSIKPNTSRMNADLKDLKKSLDKLGYLLQKSEIETMEAFLSWVIAQHSFTFKVDIPTKEIGETYFKCYQEYIKIQSVMVKRKGWFDAFGTYFEEYSSKWSRQKKGQFFTPEPICNFMASFYINDKSERETVLDPACGSGRFLLASHAANPKNYHFGQDIDKICCLMSAVNMMIHGIQGEVVHCDALNPDSYFSGWAINPQIKKLSGIPNIQNLEKENSFIYSVSQFQKKKRLEELERIKKEEFQKQKDRDFLEIDKKDKIEPSDNSETSFDFF